jgi:hypothetical protein
VPGKAAADHGGIFPLLRELLERVQKVDQKLETDPHSAIKDEVQIALG